MNIYLDIDGTLILPCNLSPLTSQTTNRSSLTTFAVVVGILEETD